eukprot:CAMPEP_0206285492 /NCGR_PEP_ID=MMETSP0106_2-20121207/125_1 /ASSEMBLY_ACC=CAM_ASM_000206 /TAXON_ID=81532 /ORGANISM="Acanthoeca-like sp., Strain 10tr" /LENGTH=234 /DNA_ID=CAMNT_0053716009 /DNA_START=174 /DNA_END=878 /DNA_ORIENTATION=+
MASRKPLDVGDMMKVYNIVTVLFNAYILATLVAAGLKQHAAGTLNSMCAPVDYSKTDPAALQMAWGLYLFYLSKAMEFVDTFLMVLRKKTQQVTFLHLYHHSTMFPIWWIGVNWVAGGNSVFGAVLNSFVHVLMYSYYFLSAVGVHKRWLWWKRYLTQLQITQFWVVFAHAAYSIVEVYWGRCHFPLWMGFANIAYMVSMIVLFGAFYARSYGGSGASGATSAGTGAAKGVKTE